MCRRRLPNYYVRVKMRRLRLRTKTPLVNIASNLLLRTFEIFATRVSCNKPIAAEQQTHVVAALLRVVGTGLVLAHIVLSSLFVRFW